MSLFFLPDRRNKSVTQPHGPLPEPVTNWPPHGNASYGAGQRAALRRAKELGELIDAVDAELRAERALRDDATATYAADRKLRSARGDAHVAAQAWLEGLYHDRRNALQIELLAQERES